MNSLCWILEGGETSAIQPLVESLGRQGYVSTVLTTPNLTWEWLADKVPSTPTAIFVRSQSITTGAEILHQLRSSDRPGFRHLPLFWVFDDGERARMEEMVAVGADDLICIDSTPEELHARLVLRASQAETRQKTEEQNRQQAAEVAKSETILRQREEFLSVCAHDLRSPLGLIQSSIAMVINSAKGSGLSPMHQELLSRAKRQAGHALALVKDLLDVMAFEQGLKPQYQMLALDELLKEFYADYRFQAEQKQVRFHYENPIEKWRILADGDRIRQLLQNLFTNALKFTDPGKNIFLTVMPFQGKRRTDPPYPMIVISLKDEGRGIPQDEIQKIFDRFTQLKDQTRTQGRGLGLSVAKQISTLHDGNIWVQSVEGQGSTFFVLFPHVVSRTSRNVPAREKKLVLVAEPSQPRREAYFEKLKGWGHDVVFARDGIEAVTLLFHHRPDALVLTANLAKLDETEVSNIAKGDPMTSEIPLFFATEAGQKNKRHEHMLFDHALTLPFEQDALVLPERPKKKKSVKRAA